jgi:hypothetical protein
MKLALFRHLLFVALLLVGNVVHAEGECPLGMFPTNPAGTQGPVGCAPIPGYDQQQPPTQQGPISPPPQWADRWGAMAIDSDKGVLGTAIDISNKSAAQQSAIADCHAKGGAICKLGITYYNQCASLVVSKEGHAATAAATIDEAVQLGMKTCTDAGYTNCHAGYTACSMPVRIK